MTIVPKQSGSARLDDVPEPPIGDGPVVVEVMAVGICGTDLELVQGDVWAGRLVLGHSACFFGGPEGFGVFIMVV